MDLNQALEFLRKQFIANNEDLAEKLQLWENGETVSGHIGDYTWDYIRLLEVKKRGFLATSLIAVFEELLLLHFFGHLRASI